MIGTLINFTTVMVGGTLGLLIGGRLPDHLKTMVISAIGLMTIAIGTAAAIKTENALIPLLALVLGSILGEQISMMLYQALDETVEPSPSGCGCLCGCGRCGCSSTSTKTSGARQEFPALFSEQR